MHMYIRLNVRLSTVLYDNSDATSVLMKATLVAMMSILLEIQDKIVFVNKCRDHLHFLTSVRLYSANSTNANTSHVQYCNVKFKFIY